MDKSGKKVSGVIKGRTYGQVDYVLNEKGIMDLAIHQTKNWWQLEFGKSVKGEVLLQTTRQLASFANAGIPTSRALAILATTTEEKTMRSVLDEIVIDIEGGATLSQTVAHYPQVFPSYYPTILGAAERSGDLAEALATLNIYLERDLRSKRAVRSAMTYPIVLMLLTIAAISVLSLVVLPRFETFFTSLNVKLPLTTRMLLNSTRFIGLWWWALLAGIALTVIVFVVISRTDRGRFQIDRALLHMPIFGDLINLVALERFCRVLSTLVKTKVSLPDAMTLAGKATGNRVYQAAIEKTREGVLAGRGLAEPLQETKVFPAPAIQILRVGEESGQLEEQLIQASSYYADELDHKMANFTALIEPVTLLLLGGGVGFVAVALVSAMYGIYSGVK
ncbi:MAG TPA: type II secretion system F family protein [Candidatus Nanopelagicaceae bacterium]